MKGETEDKMSSQQSEEQLESGENTGLPSPLLLAVLAHDVTKARQLLEAGADPNVTIDYVGKKRKLLHMILMDDNNEDQKKGRETSIDEMTRLLLEMGAEVDARDADGRTPLHLAGMNNYSGAAELLLAAGADVTAQDSQSLTPLTLAQQRESELWDEDEAWADTYGESLDRAIYLLHAAQKRHVFLTAVGEGDTVAVEKMLKTEHVPDLIETRSSTDKTPLHIAAERGHDAIVRLLLEGGADVDGENDPPDTPLFACIRSSTIRILLNAGATLECFFWFYVENYDLKSKANFSASTLLRAGISPNQQDGAGATLLHAATREADAPGIQALLAAGADVNARDNEKATPFHYAGFCEEDAITALLLAGANIEARNDADETPLLACLQQLYDAADDGDSFGSDCTAQFLDAGADFNVCDKNGNTPLHWISRMDKFASAVAKRVIQLTTNINAMNSKGETLLALATAEGGPHIMRLLLDAGAETGEGIPDIRAMIAAGRHT